MELSLVEDAVKAVHADTFVVDAVRLLGIENVFVGRQSLDNFRDAVLHTNAVEFTTNIITTVYRALSVRSLKKRFLFCLFANVPHNSIGLSS